jgi:hypothetical protein
MKNEKVKVFSWTAVFVGALVGLGLTFLLNLFSLAVGISIFAQQTNDKISISMSGTILFILVAVISTFWTGWVAGRLTVLPSVRKRWGFLYGFCAWCISFIMTVMLLMNTLQFTQFHSNFTSKNLTTIKITNQIPMLTESQGSNAETDKKIISLNAYVTFIFFFIGATSSAIGGYVGFRENKNEKYIL